MTTAIFYCKNGLPAAFDIRGHTDYADEGNDIVCAAISALAQAALLGLTEVLGICPIYTCQKGDVHCALPLGLAAAQGVGAATLLRTLHLSLQQIASQYPQYLEVQERKAKPHVEI